MSTGLRTTSGEREAVADVGVGVEFAGWLVARTGVQRSRMALGPNPTVVDLVEELTDRHGVQVRPALLEGDRLRGDTVALRQDDGRWERVFGDTRLSNGDRVRFEFRE
ncbi:hypothetical protein [Halomarina ordinaria]|uniref:MoaD/ThiS family protein n=1 Tax=Halomarina ordinaria TaxID=3033939 RepID=A0ABD5U8W0_9EURY|nr:hypothetical protein [Halomarina sp. PSRA2]